MKFEHFCQKLGEPVRSFNHSAFLSGMCQVTAAYPPGAQSHSDAIEHDPPAATTTTNL